MQPAAISGGGSGGGTAANITIGTTTITGGTDTYVLYNNAGVLGNASTLRINATAGQGPSIVAGTATTDVAALSVTRTNNNAAVATGVDIQFTDTTSAATFLPLRVRGGAAGTTNLLSVDKTGTTYATLGVNFGNGISGVNAAIKPGTNNGELGFGNLTANLFYVNGNTISAVLPSGGTWNWTNSTASINGSSTFDTGLSRVAAGVIGVGTGAQGSVAGAIRGLYQAADGTAGVAAFGPGVVTSITIKNGLVVAIA